MVGFLYFPGFRLARRWQSVSLGVGLGTVDRINRHVFKGSGNRTISSMQFRASLWREQSWGLALQEIQCHWTEGTLYCSNIQCVPRLMNEWMNAWKLVVRQNSWRMHQQMYHGMEKPCELQFRHCFPYHPTWPLHRNSLILEILKFLNYSYFAKIYD